MIQNTNDSSGASSSEKAFEWPTQTYGTQSPLIVQWVMRGSGGIIKSERQATAVLVIFVILALAVSIGVLSHQGDVAPIHSITTPDVMPR